MAQIRMHKNARLTAKARLEIRQSPPSVTVAELAARYNVTRATISKSRGRADVNDLSSRRHNLGQSTTPQDEAVILELKDFFRLSLDDIVEVMRRCLGRRLSRSAVNRCLCRYGANGRWKEDKAERQIGKFDAVTKPGFTHMDVKHLPRLTDARTGRISRSYVYAAIDRATRFVHVEVLHDLRRKTARGFVARFVKAFGYPVHTILTDNGMEWTDRCNHKIKPAATGGHEVDRLCAKLGIEHRLTRIRRPQTNGMIERFNRRLNEALAKKEKVPTNSGRNSFHTHEERNAYILQFVENYNRTRLRCLDYQAPLEKLNSFKSDGDNHTEPYTQAWWVWSVGRCGFAQAWGCDGRENDGLRFFKKVGFG